MPQSALPTQQEEMQLWDKGYTFIAGIDEVGRGALAGPVVAASVVLPDLSKLKLKHLELIRDSKTLSEKRRDTAAEIIRAVAITIGIGEVPSSTIDTIGIGPATKRAMQLALDAASAKPDYLLVDGNISLEWESVPCTAIVRGDKYCSAISAASLIAKVHRDALMQEMSFLYPAYNFDRNKGYGAAEHIEAIKKLGACPIHRLSFAPMKAEK